MPYTVEDYVKEVTRKNLDKLTPKERLSGLSLQQRLAGMSPEQIEAYLKQIRKGPPASPKKKTKPKK